MKKTLIIMMSVCMTLLIGCASKQVKVLENRILQLEADIQDNKKKTDYTYNLVMQELVCYVECERVAEELGENLLSYVFNPVDHECHCQTDGPAGEDIYKKK